MSWPLGELKALATKAARGAGFSWSLAEEAGYATQWLESHGGAGISHLSNYLQWVETNGLLEAPVDMLEASPNEKTLKCPIALGCLVADTQSVTNVVAIRVKQPALLLPFVSLIAGSDSIACKVNGVSITVCADGIDHETLELAELGLAEATVSWQPQERGDFKCVTNSRASDDKEAIRALLRFADTTYAPATEASRLGAGAGTSDND